ncbi:LpxL/LpxP family acyltransferase [Flavihumibacter petaseus]|uniref:Putative acyltransferase n=1 Tax=Flavihumibacter petaseus NBRC 106054 TaxID=1220578 RepID=A0A0E9MX63_9BACT|nr:lipid A biosynthesis acyltransferase [Flavihumibacter petaseus]GAO42093.1 putative acyltransferase [Flavihumibacter petaseus NBRC 106054]
MPSWQGKSKTTPLGYRIFVWVLRTLGLMPAYGLLTVVAIYYCFFSPVSTRNLQVYFRQRLGYGKWKTWRSIYSNYYCFGQTLIDKIAVQAGLQTPFTFDFDGEEHLRQMVAGGRGGLLISAHIGNWEIAGHLLKRLNTTINVVMFDGEDEKIKAYLEQVTGGRNMKVILIKADLSHIFAIHAALEANELVCMHADRFVAGNKTVQAEFLGAPAHFPAGPFVLGARLGVPVSFVYAFKESATHYHFFASELKSYGEPDRKEREQKMLADFLRETAAKTRQYPLQWFNYYDFWKADAG